MKRFITLITAVFISLSFISSAQAQDELTIGYVNPQAILAKMPETKAIQQRIQNFVDQKQSEVAALQDNFESEITRYDQRSSVISAEARRAEEERLTQMEEELITIQRQAQSEIQAKRQELLGPLFTQIGEAIDNVATNQNLSYVLNTTTSNGDLIILYASQEFQQKYDITEAVMRELGIYN